MKLIVHWNKLTQLYVMIPTWDDCLSVNGETLKIGVKQTHQCIYILIRNHIKITQHWRDFVIDVFKLSHLSRTRLLPWHAPAFKPLQPQIVNDTIYRCDICITAIQHWGESSMYFIYLFINLFIYFIFIFTFFFFFFFFGGGGGGDLNKAHIKQFSCPCIFVALRSNLAYGLTILQFILFIIDFIIAELSCLSFIHWRSNCCVISNVVTYMQ